MLSNVVALVIVIFFRVNIHKVELEPLNTEISDNCRKSVDVLNNFEYSTDGKYYLHGYEYNPFIYRFDDMYEGKIDGSECFYHTNEFSKPVIIIDRFDVFNIYEMFHSLLNTYIMTSFYDVNNFTILFVDDHPKTQLSSDMYGVFTNDIVYGSKDTCYKFNLGAYKTSGDFTSLLVTKHGVLRGRGSDHHCRSDLLRGFVNKVKTHFGVSYDDRIFKIHKNPKIIWSSRGEHKRGDNDHYLPSRMLIDEDSLIDELKKTFPGILKVDFGKISAKESVKIVSSSDVMVGVHGAGLMWSAFLPRHGGLVEIFGGDRGPSNRHYHNVASLSDIHYRDITNQYLVANAKQLRWLGNKKFSDELIEKINQVIKPEIEPQ